MALLRSFYFQALQAPRAGKSIPRCSLKAALIGFNRVNILQERLGSSPVDQISSSSPSGSLRTARRFFIY
jgi:hypothetical protein